MLQIFPLTEGEHLAQRNKPGGQMTGSWLQQALFNLALWDLSANPFSFDAIVKITGLETS